MNEFILCENVQWNGYGYRSRSISFVSVRFINPQKIRWCTTFIFIYASTFELMAMSMKWMRLVDFYNIWSVRMNKNRMSGGGLKWQDDYAKRTVFFIHISYGIFYVDFASKWHENACRMSWFSLLELFSDMFGFICVTKTNGILFDGNFKFNLIRLSLTSWHTDYWFVDKSF